MYQFLYNIGIVLLGTLMKTASVFHSKARLWVRGRKNVFAEIKSQIAENDKVIWLHASSLGEYEQGLPVFTALKAKYPDRKFALSFYSPSGFEVVKNKTWADVIFYLPLDTPQKVKELVRILHPELAIFVKYDFWFNLLTELAKNKIKTFFISAIFRSDQIYFKPQGKWFISIFQKVTHFFVQDEKSQKLLQSVGINQVTVSGDTRFDRVKMLLKRDNHLDWLVQFKQSQKLIVAGSTWKEDDELLENFINQKLTKYVKILIAPHNMNTEYFQKFKSELNAATILFSAIKEKNPADFQVLILDTVGLLTKVYSYADIAYVGGGFTRGIHNVLEPAVFGIPVLYGANFQKFIEAQELLDAGGSIVVHNQQEMDSCFTELFDNEEKRENIGLKAKNYVLQKPDSTEVILKGMIID